MTKNGMARSGKESMPAEHQGGQHGDRHRARQHDEGEAAQPETEGDGHAEGHGQREHDDEEDDQHASDLGPAARSGVGVVEAEEARHDDERHEQRRSTGRAR